MCGAGEACGRGVAACAAAMRRASKLTSDESLAWAESAFIEAKAVAAEEQSITKEGHVSRKTGKSFECSCRARPRESHAS